MKVVQLPFCYHPDPVGGTEVYVEALARHLAGRGVTAIVAAPGERTRLYNHNGIRVRRFRVSADVEDPGELYGEGDEVATREFEQILEEEQPDLVHLHALTRGVSLRIARAAKARKIPVYFTYHTPTVTCLRGTLLRWGTEICAGEMASSPCAACALHGMGLNRFAANTLSHVPPVLGRWAGRCGLKGGAWTALRMPEFVEQRHRAVRALLSEVDHVIAVCDWVRDLLRLNGVPSEKITLSRQGLADANVAPDPQPGSIGPRELRVVFLGRLDPTKGADLLIEAIRRLPQFKVSLDLYGAAQGEAGEKYEQKLNALAGGDQRIRFHSPVAPSQVVALLQNHDLLAVPSQWLESGPLVVLEAFAAGVPVLGSNLGGIRELVEHGINGFLVEHDKVEAWAAALEKCANDPQFLSGLRQGIRPPRTMATVADEMLALYHTTMRRSANQAV